MIPILGKTINYQDYTAAAVQAHVVGWFNQPGHVKMSFNSADDFTIDADMLVMRSRGIKGINFDWYGPESNTALTAMRLLNACDRNGLAFSICIDHGAIDNKHLTGAAADAEYIRIINFMADAFFTWPAYLLDAGRAVVTFFNMGGGANIQNIRTGVAGLAPKLALVSNGSSGLTAAGWDGGFGWVNPVGAGPTAVPTDINLPSLNTFISAAAANPSKIAFYPTYPGFDDSAASWTPVGQKRIMSRRLGQTTLDTLALIPKSAKYAMLATWDDFEEQTATKYMQG